MRNREETADFLNTLKVQARGVVPNREPSPLYDPPRTPARIDTYTVEDEAWNGIVRVQAAQAREDPTEEGRFAPGSWTGISVMRSVEGVDALIDLLQQVRAALVDESAR